MAAQCKNQMKNGNEWQIGGKLTILPGGEVTGLPVAAYQADAGADVASVAALRAEHNELLAKLRAAGLMAAVVTIAVTTQPADLALVVGGIDATDKLTAAFAVSDGGTPTHQWYSNTTESNEGGTAVEGATDTEYAIPTDATAGTTYYYCVASYEGITKATDAAAVVVSAAE